MRVKSTSFVPVDPSKIIERKTSWVGVEPNATPRGKPVCFAELRDLPTETVGFRVANLSLDGHNTFATAIAVQPERLEETRSPFNNSVTGKYAAVYLEGSDAEKLKWKPGDLLQIFAVDANGREIASVDVNSSDSLHLKYPEEKSVLVKGGLLQPDQWQYDTQLPSQPMREKGFRYADKVWVRALDATPPKPDLTAISLVHDDRGNLSIKGRHAGGDLEAVELFATDQHGAAGTSAFKALAVNHRATVGEGGVFTLTGGAPSIADGTQLTLKFIDVNGKHCFSDFIVDASHVNGLKPVGDLYTTRMMSNAYVKIPFSR